MPRLLEGVLPLFKRVTPGSAEAQLEEQLRAEKGSRDPWPPLAAAHPKSAAEALGEHIAYKDYRDSQVWTRERQSELIFPLVSDSDVNFILLRRIAAHQERISAELAAVAQAQQTAAEQPEQAPGEKAARVEVGSLAPGWAPSLEVATLGIRGETQEAYYRSWPVQLTPTQFRLLWLLTAEPGARIPYSELHRRVIGYAGDPGLDPSVWAKYHKRDLLRAFVAAHPKGIEAKVEIWALVSSRSGCMKLNLEKSAIYRA